MYKSKYMEAKTKYAKLRGGGDASRGTGDAAPGGRGGPAAPAAPAGRPATDPSLKNDIINLALEALTKLETCGKKHKEMNTNDVILRQKTEAAIAIIRNLDFTDLDKISDAKTALLNLKTT